MKNKSGRICMFAGHRRIPSCIQKETREAIRGLITDFGVTEFWCGGMGEFDALCAGIVREMKREFPTVRLVLVLASMRASAMHMDWAKELYDETIVADASDGAHYKRAIGLRNRWMAEGCDVMLAYVQRDHGGAYEAARHAAKNRKPLRFVCEKPQIAQRLLSYGA